MFSIQLRTLLQGGRPPRPGLPSVLLRSTPGLSWQRTFDGPYHLSCPCGQKQPESGQNHNIINQTLYLVHTHMAEEFLFRFRVLSNGSLNCPWMGLSRLPNRPGVISAPSTPHFLGKSTWCFDWGRWKTLSKNGRFSQMSSFEVLLTGTAGHRYEAYSLMSCYTCTHPCVKTGNTSSMAEGAPSFSPEDPHPSDRDSLLRLPWHGDISEAFDLCSNSVILCTLLSVRRLSVNSQPDSQTLEHL